MAKLALITIGVFSPMVYAALNWGVANGLTTTARTFGGW